MHVLIAAVMGMFVGAVLMAVFHSAAAKEEAKLLASYESRLAGIESAVKSILTKVSSKL